MTHQKPITKPTPVITYWEAFKRTVVWHPINTSNEDDDRSGPRFWYPTYDLLAIILGTIAMVQGSPLLNELFPWWFTNGMGLLLMLAGLLCLVGVIFPKLAILELSGKLGIVFLLGAYAGTVAFLSAETGENWFAVIVLFMAVWLLGPRVTKLFIMITRQRRKEKGASHE